MKTLRVLTVSLLGLLWAALVAACPRAAIAEAFDRASATDFAQLEASPASVQLGASVDIVPQLVGDAAGCRFNYVWNYEDAWSDWSSTVLETGNETNEAAWVFTPARAGWYRIYVDVITPDGVKTTRSVDVTVAYPYDVNGMQVSATSIALGESVTVTPDIVGDADGVRYNYVWQRGDTWDEWGSTVKDTGDTTASTSWTFTPSKSGLYHLALDFYHLDGVKQTLTTDVRVASGWSCEGIRLVAPERIVTGSSVTYACPVVGEAASYVRFNYVWQRDNWAEWSSTLLETGDYTADVDQVFAVPRSGYYVLYVDVYDTRSGEVATYERAFTAPPTDYMIAGATRGAVVSWLAGHQGGYYMGTPYCWTVRPSDCTYPVGSPRWDGFTGMNCAGFVAHAYQSCGANLAAITAATPFIPAGMGTNGEYVNAWRWYGYAISSGATTYTYDSVAALLADGKAEKGNLLFFYPLNPATTDCHLGFFWGDNPHQNLMWHSDSYGNRLSDIVNVAGPSRIMLIKGVPTD